MDSFQRGTTVICSIEVYDKDGELVSPITSMTITITLVEIGHKVVDGESMGTPDSLGKYHYDYQTTTNLSVGKYRVDYFATNNSRISTAEDWFELK